MTTYETINNEQKLMIIIVVSQKYYLVFHKDQFWDTFFNIFLADLFLIVKYIDIASYADDSTSFL